MTGEGGGGRCCTEVFRGVKLLHEGLLELLHDDSVLLHHLGKQGRHDIIR